MDTISISLNPSYYCNFRCDFCYLSDQQLSSSQRISPEVLYQRLLELSLHRKIVHVDLYGGEIGILPPTYLSQIQDVLKCFYAGKISVISNLKVVSPIFLSETFDLSVSWDYLGRESFESVYENMKNLNRPFHVLVLASKKVVELSDVELAKMFQMLNELPNLVTVEIKPYSKNKYHHQEVSHLEFEMLVKKWILRSSEFNFEFINLKKISHCLNNKSSSWSDDHIYITPEGKFSVLEFDENQNEFFMPLEKVEDFFDWTRQEKIKIGSNSFCSNCSYLGRCLSEHLQEVKNLNHSCNGFKNLLDWYRDERTQS